MGRYKVHRMTKHLRPRSQSWKTRHILTLSLIGFVWYTLVAKWSPDGRSSLVNTIRSIRSFGSSKYSEPDLEENFIAPEALSGGKGDVNRGNAAVEKGKQPEVVLNSNVPRRVDKKAPPTQDSEYVKHPIILVWKAMEYQMRLYKQHLEYVMPPECGECRVTTNRSNLAECAALVHFNAPDLQKHMDVPDPKLRNPNQIYAFWSRETPSKTYSFNKVIKDPRFDPIFNITMNFRRDSDIIDYFGNFQYELRFFWKKRTDKTWANRLVNKKSGLVMWAVSNCDSTYGATERMRYAKSLISAGLNMTTFGSCFGKRYTGHDILAEFMRHKFYMSLENSVHCPDYVSEKFWRNGLRAGAVPIVWGPTREDVSKIAPPHSYIHSEDFETPDKLVEYLNYLDKNDTAYLEYHSWRNTPIDNSIPEEDIGPNHQSTLCRLQNGERETTCAQSCAIGPSLAVRNAIR